MEYLDDVEFFVDAIVDQDRGMDELTDIVSPIHRASDVGELS
jgi:hypothetical protein